MVHQPQIRFLVGIPFDSCQGLVDRAKDAGKSDVVRWQREDVMMEPMVMKKVEDVVKGCCDVEGR